MLFLLVKAKFQLKDDHLVGKRITVTNNVNKGAHKKTDWDTVKRNKQFNAPKWRKSQVLIVVVLFQVNYEKSS